MYIHACHKEPLSEKSRTLVTNVISKLYMMPAGTVQTMVCTVPADISFGAYTHAHYLYLPLPQ